jgi:hypothetical protein
MAYTFNGIDKVISFSISTLAFDVRDLWTAYVDWYLTGDNSKYLPTMRVVGGDPLPGSKELGLTYFMLNGWKIRPYEENHVISVNGNLYSEDGSSPFTPVLGAYNVTIINTVSNLVEQVLSSTGGGSGTEILEDLVVMNEGLKKISKFIPYNEDL